MKLLVTLDFRFTRTPDGQVWTRTSYSLPFWSRYLRVFDGVKIVARVERKESVDERYRPVLGPGVEFLDVPYYLGPWQYAQLRNRVRGAVRRALSPDDAVLCRVGSRLATDLIPMLWHSRRPYGLEVVGDPYEAFARGAIRHPLRPVFRYLSTRTLKEQCARAAAVSYVTERALQRGYPARDDGFAMAVSDTDLQSAYFSAMPRVFTTSYSSTDLSSDDYALRPKKYTSPIHPRLIFVGSLEQMYKGQDVLLRAVALLVQRGFPVELRMIGEGRHRAELERLAQSLGLQEAVQFLGELPAGAAIRAELDDATLMVLPSRSEGLPRAVVEAMARALPCVATSVGGVPELLHAEDLVPPGEAAALAAKIQEVISDPLRLNRMSVRNLERAQDFRPEMLEKKRTQFYTVLRGITARWLASSNAVAA